jgi:hypothetical protein
LRKGTNDWEYEEDEEEYEADDESEDVEATQEDDTDALVEVGDAA